MIAKMQYVHVLVTGDYKLSDTPTHRSLFVLFAPTAMHRYQT